MEETFVCNGQHYNDYDKALKCFQNSKGTSFFMANIIIDGKKMTVFYGIGNSFVWDLSWKSKSWNSNQWTLNKKKKSIFSKYRVRKTIVEPLLKPQDDIYKIDKYHFSIVKLRERYYAETNKYRSRHGTPDMAVNPIIENHAQLWAESLRTRTACVNKQICHHSDKTYGENVAYGSYHFPNKVVSMWYNEIKFFNFTTCGLKKEVLHFTQLIWRGSKQMGCGISRTHDYKYFIVCKYYPPGNTDGMVRYNVPRPKDV